jgi:hypothetical protein
MATTPTLGGLAAAYRSAQAARAAQVQATPFGQARAIGGSRPSQPLPKGGFAKAIGARPAPAGPPAPNPKKVSPSVLTGSAARPRYHTPTPAPAVPRSPGLAAGATRTAPVTAPAPAAAPAAPVFAPAPTHLMGTGQGFLAPPPVAGHLMGTGVGFAPPVTGAPAPVTGPVTATPVPAAPPPATPTPAATAASPAAAPDPYAGYPPEIAALMRLTDESTAAQQKALGGYFQNQALGAQDFATAIGQQTGNLAALAGLQPQTPTGLGMAGGPVASLGGQMTHIAQGLGAGQGLNITNAAALMPGFLRQSGLQAQTSVSSANLKAHGQIISDYITRQAELAKVEAQQAGATAREQNQAATNAAIQAKHDSTRYAGNILRLMGVLGTNLTKTQVEQIKSTTGLTTAQINAGAKQNAADTQASATRYSADQRLNAAIVSARSRSAGSGNSTYMKSLTDWGKGLGTALSGGTPTPTTTQKVKDAKGNTISEKGWVDAQGNFTRTPPVTGTDPEQLMRQGLAHHLKPRDVYNLVVAAFPSQGIPVTAADGTTTYHPLVNPEIDLYNALGGTPAARKLTLQIAGVDPVASQNPGYS